MYGEAVEIQKRYEKEATENEENERRLMALEEEYERKRLHFETILSKRRVITHNKYDNGQKSLISDADEDGV